MASQLIVATRSAAPDADGTTAGGSASGDQVIFQFDPDMPLETQMQALARARAQITKHLRGDDVA